MGDSHTQPQALLTDYDAGSPYSEALFTLFANIRLNWDSQQRRELVLLLTSPANAPEQAGVAADLAIAAAQSGTPALLVDANVRHPELARRFGQTQSAGFADLLHEEQISPQKVARYIAATFVPGLWLLAAGNVEMPAGIAPCAAKVERALASLRRFLEETQEQPGLVVVNAPPVLAGADASLLSARSDQTFLVIVTGRSTRAQARKAQEQLQRAHAHLTGVIMTQS